MFNHSTNHQNVVWRRNLSHQTVVYTALRDISAGEELCISYGGNLWFKDADASTDKEDTAEEVLGGIQI